MESATVVAIYESRLWRRNPLFARITGSSFEDELRMISQAVNLDAATRVLDLACGPGIYTRPFAQSLSKGRVVGLDLSWPMLRHARRKARAAQLDNLDLVRGSALSLPFASGCFDAVSCCGALHLFPDVPRALSEIRRVLAPGGRFAAAVFREGERAGELRAAAFRRRVFGVEAFTRDGLERDLGEAGFSSVRVLHEHGPWMIVAGAVVRD